MSKHKRKHQRHLCKNCGHFTKTVSKLKKHKEKEQKARDPVEFKCNFCYFKSTHKSHRDTHTKIFVHITVTTFVGRRYSYSYSQFILVLFLHKSLAAELATVNPFMHTNWCAKGFFFEINILPIFLRQILDRIFIFEKKVCLHKISHMALLSPPLKIFNQPS